MKAYCPLIFLLVFQFSHSFLEAQNSSSKLDSIRANLAQIENDSMKIREIIGEWNKVKFSEPELSQALLHEGKKIADRAAHAWSIDLIDYNQGLLYYLAGKYDSALLCYERSHAFWLERGQLETLLLRHNNILSVHYALGDYQKVIEVADSLILVAREEKLIKISYGIQSLSALAHNFIGNKSLAMQKFLQCASYFEEEKDSTAWADNLVYVGEALLDLGRNAEARNFFHQARQLYYILNDQYYLTQTLNDLGLAFLEDKLLDSSLVYLRLAENQARANESSLLSIILLNKAKTLAGQEKHGEAEALFREALKGAEAMNDRRAIISISNDLGEFLLNRRRDKDARISLNRAERFLNTTDYQTGRINNYMHHARLYRKQKNWEAASEYLQKAHVIKDSLYEKESLRQQSEMLILYESEKKEKELLIQQQENASLQQEIQLNEIRLRNTWIISALVSGIAVLFFIIYRQIQIRKRVLQRVREKKLEQEVEFQHRALSTHALHMISKNQLLNEIKRSIERLDKSNENHATHKNLIHAIEFDQKSDRNWEHFRQYFNQIHTDFEKKIRKLIPDLTNNEMRLLALLKMNLSLKEIAGILNIAHDSVHKATYRIRKKLQLDKEQTLQQFVMNL